MLKMGKGSKLRKYREQIDFDKTYVKNFFKLLF